MANLAISATNNIASQDGAYVRGVPASVYYSEHPVLAPTGSTIVSQPAAIPQAPRPEIFSTPVNTGTNPVIFSNPLNTSSPTGGGIISETALNQIQGSGTNLIVIFVLLALIAFVVIMIFWR